MEIIKALLLGIVQGATEFLPISSSGHLVIGAQLLDFENQGILFDVFLHLGTLLSVFIFFRDELKKMIAAPFLWLAKKGEVKEYLVYDFLVILATLPAVFVGLFLKDQVAKAFDSVFIVYVMLFVTGLLMVITHRLKDKGKKLGLVGALVMGVGQACAILPGLSRSGTTIFAGMLFGMNREKVARFSFIMSVPAILGAAVLQIGDGAVTIENSMVWAIVAGCFASSITGYFAIILLLELLKRNRLNYFGYYCFFISFVGLCVHLLS